MPSPGGQANRRPGGRRASGCDGRGCGVPSTSQAGLPKIMSTRLADLGFDVRER